MQLEQAHSKNLEIDLSLLKSSAVDSVGNCNMRVKFTGSVGMGYAERFGAPFVQEVVASAKLIETKYSHVRTFIDIGGEDSKMIFFEDGKSPDIRMNGSCAGGTGAFIDQTATLLGVNTIDLDAIGVPLAVSADYSFIVPSANMMIHPVRMSGMMIGVSQTYVYFERIQERILRFVTEHSGISYEALKAYMLDTSQMAKDVGTILDGEDTVKSGLIDAIGGISDAVRKLKAMMGEE